MAHVSTLVKLMECLRGGGIVFLLSDQTGGVGVRKIK